MISKKQLCQLKINSIEEYMSTIQSIPVLTSEDEYDLGKKVALQNDRLAAQTLILSHLRLVAHLARKYKGYGLPIEDLIQEGNIGLMKSVKKFDPERGFRLSSFAIHYIRAEMLDFIIKNWKIVKIATTKEQRKIFFNLRKKQQKLSYLSDSEAESIANDLGVKKQELLSMSVKLMAADEPYDSTLTPENNNNQNNPAHYLASKEKSPDEVLIESETVSLMRRQLIESMERLPVRSQEIIEARWLSEDKPTLSALAEKYNISTERVRQIENESIKKLKLLMAA